MGRIWGARTHRGLGASGGAEVGLELVVAGASELHHTVAHHAGDDAAERREGEEEGLRVPRPPHQPPPRRALLPQDRHLPGVPLPARRLLDYSPLLLPSTYSRFSPTLLFFPFLFPFIWAGSGLQSTGLAKNLIQRPNNTFHECSSGLAVQFVVTVFSILLPQLTYFMFYSIFFDYKKDICTYTTTHSHNHTYTCECIFLAYT